MMEIKSVSGAVLYRGDSAESLREAVIAAVREGADLSGADLSGANLSAAVVSATIDAIADALRNGEEVKVPGIGTLKPKPVAERTRRNPATGKEVTVPAHTKVVFKPAAGLRGAA